MTSKEMLQLAETLGLGPKELAHLVGATPRAVRRGVRNGGAVDALLRAIDMGLQDKRGALSVRAVTVIAARGKGLELLLKHLFDAYVTVDLLRVR